LTWPEEMSQLAKNKTLRKEAGSGKKKISYYQNILFLRLQKYNADLSIRGSTRYFYQFI
jgi:hypothetical protein